MPYLFFLLQPLDHGELLCYYSFKMHGSPCRMECALATDSSLFHHPFQGAPLDLDLNMAFTVDPTYLTRLFSACDSFCHNLCAQLAAALL
jgi:hypothetical protein